MAEKKWRRMATFEVLKDGDVFNATFEVRPEDDRPTNASWLSLYKWNKDAERYFRLGRKLRAWGGDR